MFLAAPIARSQEADQPVQDDQDIEEDDLKEDQLKKLHQLMDLDGNGQLSLAETLAYSRQVAKTIASKEVPKKLEEIDTTKDGRLSLEEHMADLQSQSDGGDAEDIKELASRMEVEKAKFAAADKNKDQHLDIDELMSLFHPETHDDVLSVTVLESLKQKDKNGDGQLTPHEFWEADEADAEDGQLNDEEKNDFRRLDLDGNGVLSASEIRSWESGRFHTEKAMKSMFDVADKDGDMHLSLEEMSKARAEIAQSDAQSHLVDWAEHHEL